MTANRFRKKKKAMKEASRYSPGRLFSELLDGTMITRNTNSGAIPFIIYLSGLALFLIFNTYYAEKMAREADMLRREMTEMRINYIQTKSEYMYLTNRSELAQRLRNNGFIEPTKPPTLIYDHRQKEKFWQRLFDKQ
jgi:hypothetical protein